MAAQGEDAKDGRESLQRDLEKLVGTMAKFSVLTIMMLPEVYMCVQFCHIIHFKYVLFIVFQVYLIKSV